MSWLGKVRHFSPGADLALNDPAGDRLSITLMEKLDAMREEVGIAFIITSGFRELTDQERLIKEGLTESLGSAHVSGEGVDGYFVGLSLLTTFAFACRFGFFGIGLYPWTSTGQSVIHLDVMDRGKLRAALWIRNRVSRYVYAPSDAFRHEWRLIISHEYHRLWAA